MPILERAFACLALFALLYASPAHAADLQGIWRDETGSMRVRIAPCGAALCGSLVWLQEPHADEYNPDPTKRSQPLLGLRIFSGLAPTDNAGEWKGSVYNPEDGRTYLETITVNDKQMTEQGCVNAGLICRSIRWTKVN